MKYKDNGQWKEIYVKALDSMPVGTEVDFDGQTSDIPVGWERVQAKQIDLETVVWTYNTNVKFYTLPYSSGVHSYIITGVVSYAENALYSNVMLLVTQTGTNVRIDRLVGSSSNIYSATGVDLYVKQMEAQANLRLYGVCYILR